MYTLTEEFNNITIILLYEKFNVNSLMTETELLEIFPQGRTILVHNLKQNIGRCQIKLKLNAPKFEQIRNEMADLPRDQLWINEWRLELLAEENEDLLKLIKQGQWKIKALMGLVKPSNNRITDEDIHNAKQIPIETLYPDRLRKQGTKLWGKCRFHNERSASFVVYPTQNSWWCYGCNQGGSSIDYVMRDQNLTFIEAIKFLLHK